MKHALIAYFLGNIFAKNCCNRTVCVKIIASQKLDIFWDSVIIMVAHFGLSESLTLYERLRVFIFFFKALSPTSTFEFMGLEGWECEIWPLSDFSSAAGFQHCILRYRAFA